MGTTNKQAGEVWTLRSIREGTEGLERAVGQAVGAVSTERTRALAAEHQLSLADDAFDSRMSVAENDIEALKSAARGGVRYLGVTSEELSDGCTNNPIAIDGVSVLAYSGDLCLFNKVTEYGTIGLEFLFTGTKWSELGSSGTLRALAFKDSASGMVTPTGSVQMQQPTVATTSASVTTYAVSYSASSKTLSLVLGTVNCLSGVSVAIASPVFTGNPIPVVVS